MVSLRRAQVMALTSLLLSTGRFGRSYSLLPSRILSGAHPTFFATTLFASAESTRTFQEIESMRAGDIKKELESYGISTKSFLEKSELIDALKKARLEGLQSKEPVTAANEPNSNSQEARSTSTSSNAQTSPGSRSERLKKEIEACQAMKTSELKKELEDRGISTKAFFEKSEFVRALAEARVDGILKSKSAATGSDAEGYAEYKNVEVLTDADAGPKKRQTAEEASSSEGANPFQSMFGGSTNPFSGMGGMGGMGGIADMLKNMGVGGGASPFGAGGNPFGGGGQGMGDMMSKAQELMKNPKVRELFAKAQANPALMKKVQECMSNPMAISKYQNDPDVRELIQELRKYM